MPGEPIALKIVNKVNEKLTFFYRISKILIPELRIILYNAFIQPHFDYACVAWYPNLTEKEKVRYKLCKINVYCFVLD